MSDENARIFALLRDAVPPWEPQPFPNGETLSAETIYAAIMAVNENKPYTVCLGSNRHVIHPKVYDSGGWTHCGNCFMPLYVPTPEER